MIPAELAHAQHHALMDAADRLAPTDDQLAQAKLDLIDELVTQGREYGDWSLADFIDLEQDQNGREFAEKLATIWDARKDGAAALQCALQAYFESLVAKHLPEDLTEERADELIADEGRP